jgi:hypothetical protein
MKLFRVPHAGRKATTRMNVQHSRSIWQQECQTHYPQVDHGVKSVTNRVMTPITA